MKKLIAVGALVLAGAAWGYTFEEQKDIAYSSVSPRCTLDVKWPRGVTNFATVVNFHGGGLTNGSKHYAPWPIEAKDCDPVAFVAVNYRLLRQTEKMPVKQADGSVTNVTHTVATATPEETLTDAAAAVAWTLDHIASYGGDPKKVFVTGISAGGYLTAMLGLDPEWLAKFNRKPGDLAGIVPLTGQMTKHFNVRKIGFQDGDPQFQPKIDRWAPLNYAHGAGLPPAAFVTGGRDLEWKGRVEENEDLAVALRVNGYPKTEFHETEGDHGGGVRASAYFLRDFVMKKAASGGVARFAPGERVIFYGDSITHGGRYIYYLQLFQNMRHPGEGVRLFNGGRSGGTASDGLQRFERDVLPIKVDRAFIMFGMNDVGRGNWHDAVPSPKVAEARARSLDFYRTSMEKLVNRFEAAGIQPVLITPSPFDQYGVFAKENIPHCNDGLAQCAEFVRTQAARKGLGLVEFHHPMSDLFAAHAKDYHFCGDRVHPGNTGHLLMAAYVLDAMHVSPLVARVALDARTGKVEKVGGRGRTVNVRVTDCCTLADEVAFTYAPKALPFPKVPEYVEDEKFFPLTARFNQEILEVQGLAPGNYKLAFDGKSVGSFTAAAFSNGVNIALLDTPNQLRAQAVVPAMRRLADVLNAYRNVVLVRYMVQDAKINPADRAAADAYLEKWLDERKASPWYKGVLAWVRSYQRGRDTEPAARMEIENLYEIMATPRPAVSRVTITREK